MKRPHKFKHVTNQTSSYDWGIYCEYCGLVVYDANREKIREENYKISINGCPLNIGEEKEA